MQNFVIHARLIPHGATAPGQNWWRSWPGNVGPMLGPGRSSLLMKTWAKVPDVGKDWDLQVKLQWKRDLKRDWNHARDPVQRSFVPGIRG